MLHLITDFDLHVTYDKEDMGTVPVSFDGTTYTMCDACYALADAVGSGNHGKVMARIMALINAGHTYGMLRKTVWRITPL